MIFRVMLTICLSLVLCLPSRGDEAADFNQTLQTFKKLDTLETPTYEIPEPTEAQKAAFSVLKAKFPGPRVDTALTTLKTLSESQPYLAFLRETHPEVRDAETFEAFMKQVLPPKERYFPFFEVSLGLKTVAEMTEEDLRGVHIFANSCWKTEARALEGEDFKDIGVFLNPDVQSWMATREMSLVTPEDPTSFLGMMGTLVSVRALVSKNQKADAALVGKYFQRDGEADGVLWIALQNPILFQRILAGFTDVEVFRKWAAGAFYKKKEN